MRNHQQLVCKFMHIWARAMSMSIRVHVHVHKVMMMMMMLIIIIKIYIYIYIYVRICMHYINTFAHIYSNSVHYQDAWDSIVSNKYVWF